MKKTTITKILLAILPICIVLLFLDRCSLSQKYENTIVELDSANLKNAMQQQTFTTKLNEKDKEVHFQKAIVVQTQKALSQIAKENFDLKKKDEKNAKTIAYFREITKTKVDSVGIPYKDTLAMKQFGDSLVKECAEILTYMRAHTITVPRKVEKFTEDFRFVGEVSLDSFRIHSLVIPDTLNVRFVEKKRGFLKRKGVEVQWTHSNPYVTTTQANSVIYIPKKKNTLSKILVPAAIGVGVGLLIEK